MNDLLTMLNHLLSEWLAGQKGGAALQIREIKLDGQGLLLLARVDHKSFQGEVVMRLQVEPPQTQGQTQTQTLRLMVESWPEQMPKGLEPFRKLLESARLKLELDFGKAQS